MVTVNLTNAYSDLCNLIEAALNHEVVTITTENGNVVLVSEEDWESVKETLYLMGDPDFMRDVEEANATPDSDFEAWN
jgi:PHD/YefM family antitoxin component YafN of YafNO toxin-antitoxin module